MMLATTADGRDENPVSWNSWSDSTTDTPTTTTQCGRTTSGNRPFFSAVKIIPKSIWDKSVPILILF
ncbi:hypothetical protein T03_1686 [Trichinella britovi]|uniref:Uncharacterized protein n=1 Tax=Trichinella britovi TaxID=45882 RepID=A0A0V1D4W8_TRIBR|nr:hypothetical protein T03_1686 [Trichinella britovi]